MKKHIMVIATLSLLSSSAFAASGSGPGGSYIGKVQEQEARIEQADSVSKKDVQDNDAKQDLAEAKATEALN